MPGGARVHAFLWDGTMMQDLGTLGGADSLGYAINDSGQVTGTSTASDATYYAFLWDGTKMLQLSFGGGEGQGRAINDSGQVTGYSLTDDGT